MNKPEHGTGRLIERVIPGIGVARTYQRRWLRADLIAGVTIFAMLVPQGMAYGELAGIAPVVGLYTALAGLIAYRFDAPLFFANADYFLTQARELIAAAELPIAWFLIDAEAIIDIDVTAVEALKKLYGELDRKGIALVIARASQPLQKMLKRGGLTNLIGTEHIYPTVRTGVQSFLERKRELAEEMQ
jgi:MFS superfamily sulfate permease-like transporter